MVINVKLICVWYGTENSDSGHLFDSQTAPSCFGLIAFTETQHTMYEWKTHQSQAHNLVKYYF